MSIRTFDLTGRSAFVVPDANEGDLATWRFTGSPVAGCLISVNAVAGQDRVVENQCDKAVIFNDGTPAGVSVGSRVLAFFALEAGSSKFVSASSSLNLSVDTEASLSLVDVSSLLDGARAYVASHRSQWTVRTQAFALQPHEVIASSVGTRQWVREPISHLSWALQATWFLDSTGAGNDEADGSTSLTPLATNAELWRRLGYGAEAVIRQVTTFQHKGDFAVADPLKLALRVTGAGVYVEFHGTVTASVAAGGTGVLAAKTDLARPALATVTGAAGFGALVPASNVGGGRVTITGGGNAGKQFWMERLVAGDQVEISPPWAAMPRPNTGIGASTTVAAADPYQVETLSQLNAVDLSIWMDNSQGPPNFNVAYFVDYDLSFSNLGGAGGPSIRGQGAIAQVVFQGCALAQLSGINISAFGGAAVYNNCRFNRSNTTGGGVHFILGGLTLGAASTTTWQTGASVIYDGDHVLQATRLRVRRGGQVAFGTCCIQNATGAAFTAEYDALPTKSIVFFAGATLLYGTGNSGVGISMGSAQAFFYTTKPTVTGAGGDTTIGSAAVTAYAAVPFVFKAGATDNGAQVNVAFP